MRQKVKLTKKTITSETEKKTVKLPKNSVRFNSVRLGIFCREGRNALVTDTKQPFCDLFEKGCFVFFAILEVAVWTYIPTFFAAFSFRACVGKKVAEL